MRNPLLGVVTSEHEDDGGYRYHRGRDIGTRDLNNLLMPVWVYGVGRPVYAAFSGWWVDIVRWSKPGNRTSTWAPTRTGNGGYIRNPDGEAQGYNHVAVLSKWSEGDWIEEGELIGHLDLSGNMSAPHLHFETWANWRDPYSDFSPKILFDKYGVDTMDDPATIVLAATTTTPKEDDMTPAQEAKLDRALFLLDSIPQDVWGHEFAHPRTGNATPARAFLASGYANGQAVHAMIAAVAEKSGIDPIEVERIIRDAIEKGLAAGVELEAKINVKEK